MRVVICILFAILFAASIHAATIHVPTDQLTIQAGINAAVNEDTVLVAPEVYSKNLTSDSESLQVISSAGANVTDVKRLTGGIGINLTPTGGGTLSGYRAINPSIGEGIQTGEPLEEHPPNTETDNDGIHELVRDSGDSSDHGGHMIQEKYGSDAQSAKLDGQPYDAPYYSRLWRSAIDRRETTDAETIHEIGIAFLRALSYAAPDVEDGVHEIDIPPDLRETVLSVEHWLSYASVGGDYVVVDCEDATIAPKFRTSAIVVSLEKGKNPFAMGIILSRQPGKYLGADKTHITAYVGHDFEMAMEHAITTVYGSHVAEGSIVDLPSLRIPFDDGTEASIVVDAVESVCRVRLNGKNRLLYPLDFASFRSAWQAVADKHHELPRLSDRCPIDVYARSRDIFQAHSLLNLMDKAIIYIRNCHVSVKEPAIDLLQETFEGGVDRLQQMQCDELDKLTKIIDDLSILRADRHAYLPGKLASSIRQMLIRRYSQRRFEETIVGRHLPVDLGNPRIRGLIERWRLDTDKALKRESIEPLRPWRGRTAP